MKLVLEQILARALAVLWAAFWLWFFAVESLYFHTPVLVRALWVALGLLFVVLTIAAWRWEAAGGALLAGIGIAMGGIYAWHPPAHLPLRGVILTTAMFSVPPFVAGTLFLSHHRTATLRR